MADERTTLGDLRDLIERNHNDSERQFRAINERVERLESQREGHSDEEIVQMIDERLEHFASNILPNVIEQAVSHALEIPLNRVDESIEASRENRKAIAKVQDDLQPLVEIQAGMVFLNRAAKWGCSMFLLFAGVVTTMIAWATGLFGALS